MPALVDRDAMNAVQRFFGDVGAKTELEVPDRGKYSDYRFKGWQGGFLAQAVRSIATTNITYDGYFHTSAKHSPA
jgi:ABC-type transport system substrate-binding protein